MLTLQMFAATATGTWMVVFVALMLTSPFCVVCAPALPASPVRPRTATADTAAKYLFIRICPFVRNRVVSFAFPVTGAQNGAKV